MSDVNKWWERIRLVREAQADHVHCWNGLRRAMVGSKYKRGFLAGDKPSPVNLLSSFRRTVLPNLLPRDREIQAQVTPAVPSTPGKDYERSAELLGRRLTAWGRSVRFVRELRKAAARSLYSAGILRIGFEVASGVKASEARREDSASPDGVPVDVDIARAGGNEYHDAGLPYVVAIKPAWFYPEPGVETLEELTWCAERVFRPLAALKKDPNINKKFGGVLRATHYRMPAGLGDDARQERSLEGDERSALVECYLVHDRTARRVWLLGGEKSGCDLGPLEEKEWLEGIEGLPYEMFSYEEVDDEFWPNPPLSPLFDLAEPVDQMVVSLTDSASRAKRIVVFDPSVINAEDMKRVADARDGDIVAVPGFAKGAQVIDFGGANPALFETATALKQLFDEMAGISNMHRGVAPSSPRATATEIRVAEASSDVRISDLRSEMLRVASSLYSKAGALLLVHKDALSDITLPLGDAAEEQFIDFGDPAVMGEATDYAFSIVAASVERIDPAINQKRLLEMIGQSVDPGLLAKLQAEGVEFRTGPLLERHLRSMGETNIAAYLRTAEAPGAGGGQTEAAQAEDAEMLQRGEPLPVGPGDDHAAHLAVHVETARLTQSDAVVAHAMMHEQQMTQAPEQAASPAPSAAAGTGGQVEQAAAIGAAARRV